MSILENKLSIDTIFILFLYSSRAGNAAVNNTNLSLTADYRVLLHSSSWAQQRCKSQPRNSVQIHQRINPSLKLRDNICYCLTKWHDNLKYIFLLFRFPSVPAVPTCNHSAPLTPDLCSSENMAWRVERTSLTTSHKQHRVPSQNIFQHSINK